MNKSLTFPNPLPLKRDLNSEFIGSIIITVLMTGASIFGLANPSIYSTDALYDSFYANDAINLIIGLPILLGSIWAARRGSLLCLLFWPGALAFMLYNYIIYAIAMPFNWFYIIYPVLAALSAYMLFRLLTAIDGTALQTRLKGNVPERLSAGVIIFFGAYFFFNAISMLVGMFNTGEFPLTEVGLNTADIVLATLSGIGGVSLWQRKALGYKSGLGLMFLTCALFLGLVVLIIIQASLTGNPFPVVDIIVVAVMGLVFSIPLGLFVRAVRSKV